MKKLALAILCLFIWTTPIAAADVEANQVPKEVAKETDKPARGIFVDPPIVGQKVVTGFGAANTQIQVLDQSATLLGEGLSDQNGSFKIFLSRVIKKGDKFSIKDTWSEEQILAEAESLKSETRRAYVKGHRHYMKPNGYVTRAEVAMMVARLETGKMSIYGKKTTGFKDASYGWYTTAIDIVSRKGMLVGYKNNYFYPNRGMTRGEFATLLCRLSSSASTNGQHHFKDSKKHWASKNIGRAFNSGWIKGYNDGKFYPNHRITRAEAIVMLNRTLGRRTDASSFKNTGHMEKMTNFIDTRPSHWAYFHLLDAANDHRIREKSNKDDVDQWIEVLP